MIANSFLLHVSEHKIFSANKYENFMLSWVEHEKGIITSGQGNSNEYHNVFMKEWDK